MGDDRSAAAMLAYYSRGEEEDRLVTANAGQLEFERTQEIVLRHLPPPPAVIADVGGGPGRYALWLAGLGYRVLHRDAIPLHVQQLSAATADGRGLARPMGPDFSSVSQERIHLYRAVSFTKSVQCQTAVKCFILRLRSGQP